MNEIIFESPIGKLFVKENAGKLLEIGVCHNKKTTTSSTSPLLKNAKQQLLEYFEGKRKVFDLPLFFHGTEFQKRVWKALLEIPYSQTATYKDLAQKVASPKAMRAVGNANNKNNFLIVVPCHRVIGTNGKLVGYAEGIEVKAFLLNLEKVNS